MLTRLRISRFKSFVDEEVELAPLTLLVGANASGKSNFLDAIWFLHGLSQRLTLEQILNGERRSGAQVWSGIRGGSAEIALVGERSFTLEGRWRGSENELHHKLTCEIDPVPLLKAESLVNGNELLFDAELRSGGEFIDLRLASGERFQLSGHSGGSLVEAVSRTTSWDEVAFLWTVWREIGWVSLSPPEMREYGRPSLVLGDKGQNISGLLALICRDPDQKYALVTWLAELCAPELADIDFIEVPEVNDVLAVLVEKNGRRISARSLSDGTLRFLGLLIALRTAKSGSLILIEEIESGLHPARINLLVNFLETVTRERGIQVIATTHSPVVLQWLDEKSLRDTVVFGRNSDHEGTIMRRLGDVPHFEEVVARKGIDELFSTGWLEMAL